MVNKATICHHHGNIDTLTQRTLEDPFLPALPKVQAQSDTQDNGNTERIKRDERNMLEHDELNGFKVFIDSYV